MEKHTIYIESNSTDPTYNLALEQYVFDRMPKDQDYFWLWQNDNTIVVGKHQNTAQEINQEYVKQHGITVVRRLSGGGAVYHDMGNINFTFIADATDIERLNLRAFCQPVVKTLRKMGIRAQVTGRNDITIDGKKFSGNSQYIKRGRVMHHGTLMFDSDLSVVEQALCVTKDKYESKGFQSVQSRVTNIRPYVSGDMDMEEFRKYLKEYMLSDGYVTSYWLNEKDEKEIQKIRRERYATWEWNYGESPAYTVQKKRSVPGCGHFEFLLTVDKGMITGYESFGDYFGDGATPQLKNRLQGCLLEERALRERLQGFDLDTCYCGLGKATFIDMLVC